MNVLINHCWCYQSNWDGKHYDCRVIVTLDRIPKGKTYYDPPDPDWALVEEVKFTDEQLEASRKAGQFRYSFLRLRSDVLRWLHDNVKPRRGWDQPAGWAIGNEDYTSCDTLSFSFFFHRETDAMKFIRKWSVHKKPVSFLNYFKDDRRELKDGKLVKVKR